MMRFGGLLSRYYKWREGVGPARERPWYRNYVWGGKETHRVGTREFVDFCRRVNSEPLYCVNFLGDGFEHFAHKPEGNRTGDAAEAADWVSYCNDPDDAMRKAHGDAKPFGVKFWQLGNETNYGRGGFNKEQAIARTIEFAKAMRARDAGLKLIAWGDNGWAADMAERAGEHIDYIAAHMMQQNPVRKETVLHGCDYQAAPERAWEELMELVLERVEKKLLALEANMGKSSLPIAITEGHLSLQPHNASPILTEWLTGVYHARVMNALSTAWRAREDRNGGGFQRHALDHKRCDAPGAGRRELSFARGRRNAIVPPSRWRKTCRRQSRAIVAGCGSESHGRQNLFARREYELRALGGGDVRGRWFGNHRRQDLRDRARETAAGNQSPQSRRFRRARKNGSRRRRVSLEFSGAISLCCRTNVPRVINPRLRRPIYEAL